MNSSSPLREISVYATGSSVRTAVVVGERPRRNVLSRMSRTDVSTEKIKISASKRPARTSESRTNAFARGAICKRVKRAIWTTVGRNALNGRKRNYAKNVKRVYRLSIQIVDFTPTVLRIKVWTNSWRFHNDSCRKRYFFVSYIIYIYIILRHRFFIFRINNMSVLRNITFYNNLTSAVAWWGIRIAQIKITVASRFAERILVRFQLQLSMGKNDLVTFCVCSFKIKK